MLDSCELQLWKVSFEKIFFSKFFSNHILIKKNIVKIPDNLTSIHEYIPLPPEKTIFNLYRSFWFESFERNIFLSVFFLFFFVQKNKTNENCNCELSIHKIPKKESFSRRPFFNFLSTSSAHTWKARSQSVIEISHDWTNENKFWRKWMSRKQDAECQIYSPPG